MTEKETVVISGTMPSPGYWTPERVVEATDLLRQSLSFRSDIHPKQSEHIVERFNAALCAQMGKAVPAQNMPVPGVKRIIGPTILLDSGAYFDFEAPETSQITVEDIAHGLANVCRFAGQCSPFYSVAEHSVYVSLIVPPEHALAALLHDASEAFLGDISKPLKTMLPDYRVIEERVERAISARFGLPYPMAKEIKQADLVMLVTEQRQVMRNKDPWSYTKGVEPVDTKLSCLPPSEAKAFFLNRYAELTGAQP